MRDPAGLAGVEALLAATGAAAAALAVVGGPRAAGALGGAGPTAPLAAFAAAHGALGTLGFAVAGRIGVGFSRPHALAEQLEAAAIPFGVAGALAAAAALLGLARVPVARGGPDPVPGWPLRAAALAALCAAAGLGLAPWPQSLLRPEALLLAGAGLAGAAFAAGVARPAERAAAAGLGAAVGLAGTGLALVAAGLGYARVHPDAGRFAVGVAEAFAAATWVGPGVAACMVTGIAAAARRSTALAEALAATTLPATVAVTGGFALVAPGLLLWLHARLP